MLYIVYYNMLYIKNILCNRKNKHCELSYFSFLPFTYKYICIYTRSLSKLVLLPNTPDLISFYHQRDNSSPTPYSYSLVSQALLAPLLQAHKYTQISQLQASWHKWFFWGYKLFWKADETFKTSVQKKITTHTQCTYNLDGGGSINPRLRIHILQHLFLPNFYQRAA